MDLLGFCATEATRQGVEGRTLGLKSPGPPTEGFYMRGDRSLVEGVAGGAPRAQGLARVKISVPGECRRIIDCSW